MALGWACVVLVRFVKFGVGELCFGCWVWSGVGRIGSTWRPCKRQGTTRPYVPVEDPMVQILGF